MMTKVYWLRGLVVRQHVAEVLSDYICVCVGLHEPIIVIEVVLVQMIHGGKHFLGEVIVSCVGNSQTHHRSCEIFCCWGRVLRKEH